MTEASASRIASGGKPSPGEFLRQLREAQGHTHVVVGDALHLTVHYVKALEADEYGKLPGLTFVKGYLRAYARFLRADVDKVIALFDSHVTGLLDAGATERVQRSRQRQDQALRWGIGAACVVVAGIAGGWWLMGSRPSPAAAPVAAPAAPLVLATPVRQPEPIAPSPVTPVPAPSDAEPDTARDAPLLAIGLAPPDLLQDVSPTIGEETATADPATAIAVAASGARHVALLGSGSDELTAQFSGNSWIEVDDGSRVRLYNDMLGAGDTLEIRGDGPFHVLLGDATQVQLTLNAQEVDLSEEIRDDSTARVVLGAPDALVRSELAPNEDGAQDATAPGAQD